MRKKILVFVLAVAVVSIAISALAQSQLSAKRRTPTLTSDDVGSSSREVVVSPTENESRTPVVVERETFRGSMQWQRDVRRAFEVARADGKLVIADVYTDWCGWCKKMDQNIYSNAAIAALSRQQVFLKVNAEDRGQGQYFAQQMRVKGYPTTIILDGSGRVLNVSEGYISSPEAFVRFVDEARAQQSR